MCIDLIRPAIWIGGIAVVIGAICLGYVAVANLSSRNIGLGLGAFLGACVIFGMTLFFDLKRSSSTEDMGATVVLDYQSNNIQLYTSDLVHSRSIFVASEASKLLPKMANGADRLTQSVSLARDFAILVIVSYLLNEQSDWQMDRSTYRTALGTHETWKGVSTPSECTTILNVEVKKRLKDISNAFAGVQQISLGDRDLCLPPHSSMEIKPDQVTITTRICKISFALQEQFLSTMSIYPGGTAAPPPMFEGAPRYSTTNLGIRVTTEYFALRAQDRLIDKYKDWATRVVSRARIWFEGPATAS
jgi:hypothetical protein